MDYDLVYSEMVARDYKNNGLDMYYHDDYVDLLLKDTLEKDGIQLKYLSNSEIDILLNKYIILRNGYRYRTIWIEIFCDVKVKLRKYKVEKIMTRTNEAKRCISI